MEKKDSKIIDEIQSVRVENNKLWMAVLKVAIEHAPVQTKKIFKAIAENDKKINKLSRELAK